MRRVIGLCAIAVAWVAVGCVSHEPECATDADCQPGTVCYLPAKACVGDPNYDGGGGECSPACAAHQSCAGSTCVARYSALQIDAPADGSAVQPGSAVPVVASLTLADNMSANPPGELAWTLTPPSGDVTTGTLATSGETFAGEVSVGSADGDYVLKVEWPAAGLADQVTLRVDATAPNFSLHMPTAPSRNDQGNTTYTDTDMEYAQAWKRSETAVVRVSADAADVDVSSVRVRARFGTEAQEEFPVTQVAASVCGGGAAWCGEAEVELFRPTMPGFRAELTVTAAGADTAGNSSTSGSEVLKVTRWKWAHEVDTNALKAAAIGPDGTIYVGSSNGTTTGRIVALLPDGTPKWPAPLSLGAVTASPAVGSGTTPTLYAPVRDATGGSIRSLSSVDGSEMATKCPNLSEIGPIATGLTVSTLEGFESATGVANGDQILYSARPGAPAATRCRDGNAGADATAGTNAVSAGSRVFFGDALGAVRGRSFGMGTWEAAAGYPVETGLATKGLAISGSDVVGAGSVLSTGGVFAIPLTGGVPDGADFVPSWDHPTTSPAWSPVIGQNNRAFVGLENSNVLAVDVNGGNAQTPGVSGVVQATPVLGQGGWIYLARRTGSLAARRTDAVGTAVWSVDSLGTLEASPNLDCARDENGNKVPGPGTLYVASNNGKLYAFEVDSRGIDVTAPWPKYQRDPRNTGNADHNLADEFSCPQ